MSSTVSADARDRAWTGAAVGLLLILTLPFAGRAHGPDDPLYLGAARAVLGRPLDPLGGPSFWHERPTNLFYDLYNPPLAAYLLAVPVAVAGDSETGMHLFMIFIAGLSVAAAAGVGRRLGVPPRYALLLATSPALAATAVSALTDIPFLFLTLLTWALALRGGGAAAGAMAGLSALTKYVGLLNLPLAALALRNRPRRSVVAAAWAAIAVFGAFCLSNLLQHGELHVAAAGRFRRFAPAHQATLAGSFVGALGLAGLPAALGLLRWTRWLAGAGLAAGLIALLASRGHGASVANGVLSALAFGSGATLLLAASRASRQSPLAAAAFWAYTAHAVLLAYFGAARYLLPLLPPLVWLLVRGGALEDAPPRRFGVSVAAGALVTLAILQADAGWAGAWRSAAKQLPLSPGRAYQTGHWGFQHYAGRRGYAPLDPREELRAGDRVADPIGIHGSPASPAQRALLVPAGVLRVSSPSLRVMDRDAGAGFYSSAWGLLPFAFRPAAEQTVRLYDVGAWPVLPRPEPMGAVAIDLGSPDAHHVLLDGWSGDEAFDDGGRRRTFVWMEGEESALRVALPAGARRLALTAHPQPQAVGRLEIALGPEARATVALAAGWRRYEAPVEGRIAGGLTTVVLRPSGVRQPGAFDAERRRLSVAVDLIAWGDGEPEANRGVWPIPGEAGRPVLFVAGAAALGDGHRGRHLRLQIRASEAVLSWRAGDGTEKVLWSAGGDCAAAAGCVAEVDVPPGPGRLLLQSPGATVLDLAPALG